MINLDEHAIFIDRLQMDMVPLSVAKQAINEVLNNSEKVDKAIELIENSLKDLSNINLDNNND